MIFKLVLFDDFDSMLLSSLELSIACVQYLRIASNAQKYRTVSWDVNKRIKAT